MNKQELKTFIDENIVQNNSGQITASIINETYKNVIDCSEIGGENTTVSGKIIVSKEGIDISASGDNPHIGIPTASGHINLGDNNVVINGTGHIYLSSGDNGLNITNGTIRRDNSNYYINFINGSIFFHDINCSGTIKASNIQSTVTLKADSIETNNINITQNVSAKINNNNCSLDFNKRKITGFNTIQMYSGSNSEITNVGRISGATGKYIDLINGSIAGITVSGTVPSNLTPSNIYMSGSRASITNCNKLDMNPSASNGTAGTITGISGIYFTSETGVISGTIGSMTINGINLNFNKINNCSGIYFAGPTREISGVIKISMGEGTIAGLSNLNMTNGTITGVNTIDATNDYITLKSMDGIVIDGKLQGKGANDINIASNITLETDKNINLNGSANSINGVNTIQFTLDDIPDAVQILPYNIGQGMIEFRVFDRLGIGTDGAPSSITAPVLRIYNQIFSYQDIVKLRNFLNTQN